MQVDANKSLPSTINTEKAPISLPDEIVRIIFKKIVKLEMLLNASSTCKQWRRVGSEEDVGLAILKNVFPDLSAKELTYVNPKHTLIAVKNFESFRPQKQWTIKISPNKRTRDWDWDLYGNELFKPEDSSIVKYDIEKGLKTGEFTGHEGPVYNLKVVRQHLFTASEDLSIKMWDLVKKTCLQTFIGHSDWVYRIKATDEHLFTCAHDHTAKKWDLKTGICLRTVTNNNGLCDFKLKNLTPLLFLFSLEESAKIWDIENNVSQRTFSGIEGSCPLKIFDKYLFAGFMFDRNVKMWDLASGTYLKTFNSAGEVNSIKVKGNKLFIGSWNFPVRIWDIEKSEIIYELSTEENVSSAFKLVGKLLITHPKDSKSHLLKVWNVESGKCLKEISAIRTFRYAAGRLFVWEETQAQIYDFNPQNISLT